MTEPTEPPRSTYRVQLHSGFTFDDAAAVAGYLAQLGVSHMYCSPYLQAAPGSTHGYDVVDHGRLNQELGGEQAHRRLTAALRDNGLGQVLDIVPNHMALAGSLNRWWWDVLENGPASQYAAYFDIDWDPPETKLVATVLVPVLGDHYGRVLESGELELVRAGGSFSVRYHEHEVPVSPRTIDDLLAGAAAVTGSEELESIAAAFGRLPHAMSTDRESVQERHRDKEVLRSRLGQLLEDDPKLAFAVDEAVKVVNDDPDALDRLLARQNYRLAFWRTADRELDYRRFFDIDSLVGLRTEDEVVFADTHGLVLELVAEGAVDGLRVDHVDGLRDPAGYLECLAERSGGAYLVVEKILERDEQLPTTWPVAGTSGYDALARINELFVDPEGAEPFTSLYERFTGETADYADVVHAAKLEAMRGSLAADVERLTALLVAICERHRRYRDYTRTQLRDALRELIAAFPVYRTYVRASTGASTADIEHVGRAVSAAAERRPDIDAELLEFIGEVLLLRHEGRDEVELALRVQQVTSPVMAKGVEDTAFYRYLRLVSLNEVGGDPTRFGTTMERFHRETAEAARRWPASMLATSTHDTKRSEDVRARINLLSEIPERWEQAVWRWARDNERYRRGELPDRNTEYLLYQTLVGAWPLPVERAIAYMEKATREAKRATSWVDPNPEYDEAVRGFVVDVMADARFTADVASFVAPLVEPARAASLAQTTLKLTGPGVPDLYQGTELWDHSLVDPDNRRPVDYATRRRLLDEVRDASPEEVLARANDGAPKLWLIAKLLRLLPLGHHYEPIAVVGPESERVVAYRCGPAMAVVVPRLVLGLGNGWQDTAVVLGAGRWSNTLTQDEQGGGEIDVAALFARFPVAVLRRN